MSDKPSGQPLNFASGMLICGSRARPAMHKRLIARPRKSSSSAAGVFRNGAMVCTVGSTVLQCDARCIDDLHAMLKKAGDWVELGGADEQKPAKEGTVEAWGRSANNPAGGWYGLKKGLRGRFGVYVPPLMEALGLCELEHNAKNNRMRVK